MSGKYDVGTIVMVRLHFSSRDVVVRIDGNITDKDLYDYQGTVLPSIRTIKFNADDILKVVKMYNGWLLRQYVLKLKEML